MSYDDLWDSGSELLLLSVFSGSGFILRLGAFPNQPLPLFAIHQCLENTFNLSSQFISPNSHMRIVDRFLLLLDNLPIYLERER